MAVPRTTTWAASGRRAGGCPGAVAVAVGGRVVRVVVGSGEADEADESLGDSDGSDGASVTTVGGSRLASAPTGRAVPSPHAGGGPDAGSRAPFRDTEPDATSAAGGSAVSRTVAVGEQRAGLRCRSAATAAGTPTTNWRCWRAAGRC